jgi:MFS family permease
MLAPAPAAKLAEPASSDARQGGFFGFRFVMALALASTLNPINSSLISTAMVPIAQALHATAAKTAWLITALYLASAVAQPTMGKLADLFGPRRVLLTALWLVAIAGILGSLAGSLGVLIATRVLIGIGTSAAYPSAMRMFRERAKLAKAPPPRVAMSILSFSSFTVSALGPFLGGVLTASFGWHSVFAVNLPIGFAAIFLIFFWAPRDQPRHGGWGRLLNELDVTGLILFGLFLSCGMLFLMSLTQPDCPAAALTILFGAIFWIWSWRCKAPFIDLRMLVRDARLTITFVRLAAIMMINYCIFYGFAQWMQGAGDYSPKASGLMTIPMSIVAAGATLLAARSRSIRAPLLIGCGAALVGSVVLRNLDHASAPWILAAAAALFGLPMGMTSTATQAAVYIQASPEQIGSASGLQRSFQYLGSIMSASLVALCFGARPSDAGFHGLMDILAVLCGVLLVTIVIDPTIPKIAALRE